jgi:hypothetical protein
MCHNLHNRVTNQIVFLFTSKSTLFLMMTAIRTRPSVGKYPLLSHVQYDTTRKKGAFCSMKRNSGNLPPRLFEHSRQKSLVPKESSSDGRFELEEKRDPKNKQIMSPTISVMLDSMLFFYEY